jgi:ssDNA-binding Zn-finger/Zn-ribbon topoisomerase 1
LLTGELMTILCGEMTAICNTVGVFFRGDAGLIFLGCGCAPGCDLAVADAVVDAGLLACLTSADRRGRVGWYKFYKSEARCGP